MISLPFLLLTTTTLFITKQRKSRAEERDLNVLEPPFFFTFHLKRALFEFSSLPLSFSLFSSSSFFSKLAQARSPQLDVRLRPAPPRHRRLDRAVGLRGRDVNVVVELFVVSFFLSDFGGERGVSEEKKKKSLSLSKKKKKKKNLRCC